MKRRDFFKKGVAGGFAAAFLPTALRASGEAQGPGGRQTDKWFQLGTGRMGIPARKATLEFDVAVMGGGAAGMCAAVSAARNGARTVLVQDRPVLGGNASSEIRVNLNGVTHLKNSLPERETGVIEEILLLNRFMNPQESYTVWDHVLYDFVTREPNLTLLVNTQAVEGRTEDSKIVAVRCWQMSTETELTIHASLFVDCSGDGLMAATAGALYRSGREASSEFNEKYAPAVADGWQMGASILMSSKDMGKPMPYEAPSFAIKYDAKKAHPHRKIKSYAEGFWWVELGSEFDVIADQEINRHRLMGYLHGVWDYIKNSGDFPESANWALDWVGSVPGRRESRRFIGDFMLSETDLTGHRHFEDAVAYGGWSLDEHNPGGIDNLTEPPSYFHEKFSEVYEIPFGSLYSKNITNLLFAGRNISQTHIALSSSRVMATCAVMGQAAGTAAALCFKKGITPRELREKSIDALQEQLLRDDAFIPNRPAGDPRDLAKKAGVIFASSTLSGDVALLTDGYSRDVGEKLHHWESDALPAELQLEWEEPVSLSKIEIKCDTNVHRNIMLRKNYRNDAAFTNTVPVELLKALEIEARVDGQWVKLGERERNRTRLIRFAFEPVKATAIRVRMKETYGAKNAKLFEIRCYEA